MQDLQMIKELLVVMAEYLQTELTDAQLILYSEELSGDGAEFVKKAFAAIRKSPTTFYGKFPLPSQLRAIANGNDEDYALESSLKIINAISRFGWPNPGDARKFIGELGWSVVLAYGGWETICKTIDSADKIGIFQTQFKKSAEMMLTRSRLPQTDGGSLLLDSIKQRIGHDSKEPISLGSALEGLLKKDGSQAHSDSEPSAEG